jgi:hypothetical protein
MVLAFDCDEGQSEAMYKQVLLLIETMLGEKAAEIFAFYIRATENRFYLAHEDRIECWRDICNSLVNQLD